jgi:hypothetical protein
MNPFPMIRLSRLQVVGPFAVFAAVFAAEAAAYGLAHNPTSETLWYVNLRLFGIFQRSGYHLSAYSDVGGFQFFFIALPIFAAACFGLLCNRRLPLAIASNLSLVYAAFLVYSWNFAETQAHQASLTTMAMPSDAGFYLIVTLVATSLLSLAASHLLYVRAVRAEA